MRRLRMTKTRPRRRRFTPVAWAKLLWWRDRGDTEIGGFGLSAAEDLLVIEDVVLVPQVTSTTSVRFDDLAVADHFDRQVDLGRTPQQCGRIWIHTHPGHSPSPSPTDEATFQRVFGRCDWAVMVIVARGGARYARLQWFVGPQGREDLAIVVDCSRPFAGTDHTAWAEEYDRCVQPLPVAPLDRPLRRRVPGRRDLAGAAELSTSRVVDDILLPIDRQEIQP